MMAPVSQCHKCGKTNASDAKFCQECGTKVSMVKPTTAVASISQILSEGCEECHERTLLRCDICGKRLCQKHILTKTVSWQQEVGRIENFASITQTRYGIKHRCNSCAEERARMLGIGFVVAVALSSACMFSVGGGSDANNPAGFSFLTLLCVGVPTLVMG